MTTKPATWMPLHLIEPDPTKLQTIPNASRTSPFGKSFYDLEGRKWSAPSTGIYIKDGKKYAAKQDVLFGN